MVQQAFDADSANQMFNLVKEGMAVIDSAGQRVGTVDDVYFGATSPSADERGEGSATAPAQSDRGDSLVEDVARVFTDEDAIPKELRQRLLRTGYIRIGGGLLSAPHYVLPEQIAGISSDGVRLNVRRDELLSR